MSASAHPLDEAIALHSLGEGAFAGRSGRACRIADDPPRPLGFPALAPACDAFFPRIFLRRGRRVPVGTVSLNAHFHADGDALAEQGCAPLLGPALCQTYQRGFFDQHGEP